jgi:hypothetical protein
MSQLSAKDRDFLLQLAYEDDPNSHVSTPIRPATVAASLPARDQHSNLAIETLREELIEERSEVFRLRKECESLREMLVFAKEEAEKLTQEQEKRIAVINERFKEVMTENLKLKRQITLSLKHYEENSAQATSASDSLNTLRQLLLGMLDKENSRKKRDITDKRLLESLGGILMDSEPPIDFPISLESESAKSNKTDVEMRRKDDLIGRLSSKIDKLEAENSNLLAYKRDSKRVSESETEKIKRQLVGALRRIQYLIQEKTQIAAEKQELQDYCAKLEAKMLTYAGGKKGERNWVGVESQQVDLRVDRQRLMEALEAEESGVDIAEETLKKIHEASWGRR